MKQLLGATFRDAIKLLEGGETLVEIAEKVSALIPKNPGDHPPTTVFG